MCVRGVDAMLEESNRGETTGTAAGARPIWSAVVGTIAVIAGALTVVDQLDDLATLGWDQQDWARFVGPRLAEIIVGAMPPLFWRVTTLLVQLALGILLAVAGLRLRRRRRSGVRLCRLWAGLAIAWALCTTGVAAVWLRGYGATIGGAELVNWEGWAVFGIGLALAILVAFPVLLLIWFQRPQVQADYEAWAE